MRLTLSAADVAALISLNELTDCGCAAVAVLGWIKNNNKSADDDERVSRVVHADVVGLS